MIFTHNIDPILLSLGPFEIRWYGLFFALGIVTTYFIVKYIFKREKHPIHYLESISLYLFIGLIVGARLGHVIFYNPEYFFNNPLEILKIWNGGLASHGAVIGLFVAYTIWTRVYKVGFVEYADALVIGFPATAMFVRIGNFFNSEIVGIPTEGNWGVIFKQLGEDFPRHPAQLYEALLNLVILIVLLWLYKTHYKKKLVLLFLFLHLSLYFSGRFVIEFWKDLHAMPETFPLSMGQMLSFIPILASIVYFIFYLPKIHKKRKKVDE